MTPEAPKPVHCRRVDGLPGTPCKTCGRIVVRKGSGQGMYRLTHEKPVALAAHDHAHGTRPDLFAATCPICAEIAVAAHSKAVAR